MNYNSTACPSFRNVLLAACLLCSMALQAQPNSELFRILKASDSLLFDVGFNRCDLNAFDQLVNDDFEFYHDQSGITSSKKDFIASVREGICQLPYKPRRQLDAASMQVFPLEKGGVLYGAVQTGEHRFYANEKDKPEYLTSVARFTHLWLLQNGRWKLSRVFSYDHRAPEAGSTSISADLFKDRAKTEKWMAQNRIPVLGIGYVKDGKIVQSAVYGNLEPGKPAPENTIFNVASLTKPVTALVALKLVNEGKWNLDEPLFRYWLDADIANDPRAKKLTTRHVLSHQTGFANWRHMNPDEKLKFDFDPGARYQYSGEGFEYLRKALEKKFKKTLGELADIYVFKPLQMMDTRFTWYDKIDESRFAKWHAGDGSLYTTDKNKFANAADDLLTTVPDYLKFLVHILEGAGLSAKLYQEMLTNQVTIKPNKFFGLGWSIDENIGDGERALMHGGDDKGVHTIAFLLPKSKQAFLIFTNCDNGTDIYIPTILAYLGRLGQGIIDVETK